jgi:hypothetical protein
MITGYYKLGMNYISSEDFKSSKGKEEDKKPSPSLLVSAINIVFFLLAVVLAVVPAVLIARQCNPEFKVRYGILAFFFSDIYIFQWAVRKFIMNEPGYCEML